MRTGFMVLLLFVCSIGTAQKIFTRNGSVRFFSKTPLEDIKAETSQAAAAMDIEKQTLAVTVLVKGFLFTKALMQEHFNENYMESDKFPKASFAGAYAGAVDVTKAGTYPVMIKGALTLHGVTRTVNVPAVFQVQSGMVSGAADFSVKPEDFKIQIPALVREKIAPQILISVRADFKLLN